jgi:hypothetical protein
MSLYNHIKYIISYFNDTIYILTYQLNKYNIKIYNKLILKVLYDIKYIFSYLVVFYYRCTFNRQI